MMRLITIISLTAAAITACGGGNSSGTNQPPINGAGSLVITNANAKPAVRSAYGAAQQSTETGSLVSATGGIAATGGNLQKFSIQDPLSKVLTQALQQDPFGPDTFPCAVSGSTTLSGDVASIFGFAVGDLIVVESSDCDDGLGDVTNGRVEFTVTAFSGDILSGQFLLGMRVLLSDFEVATANDTLLSNGDATVTVDTTGNPLITFMISGMSMSTQSNSGTDTISDYSTNQTVDTSVVPEPYTLSSAGAVDSSDLTGQVVFSTPVTFQGAGSDYPFAGEFLVTGANGATVRLIALDNVNVRIETDADGDGTPDESEDTTWADISP